jgi:hypothetical protein
VIQGPARLIALFDSRQVSQFALGQLLEKQKEAKTSKAHLVLEPAIVEFLTQMGVKVPGNFRRDCIEYAVMNCNTLLVVEAIVIV